MVPWPVGDCMIGAWKEPGLDSIIASYASRLESWYFAMGTIVDDVFTESEWTGYARWPVSTSVRLLSNGEKALIAQVQFTGPEDAPVGTYNAIVLVNSESVVEGVVSWEDTQEIPSGGVGRWQATFRV